MRSKRGMRELPVQYEIDFEESGSQAGEVGVPHMSEASPERRLTYISFGSGSSGNSCYLGSSRGGIIIDAGVSEESISRGLSAAGLSYGHVKAVLLTHDHSDHVRYVYKLLRKIKNVHLFCTNRVLNGLLRRHSISKRIKDYHIALFKEIPTEIMDFKVTAFDVPHDGSDNMGFSIEFDGRRFVLATDMGEIQERAWHYMQGADYLVIESNYDSEMLRKGPYPEYLKARIRTSHGHMDNMNTASALKELAQIGRLKYVFLCHLSQDNNTAELALSASRRALEGMNIKVGDNSGSLEDRESDIHLMALPRTDSTRAYIFRP